MSRGVVRNLAFCMLLAAGIVACGQRGPLQLPESARPIQRIELPQSQPPAQSAPAPEKQDDEQKKNER
ncbi:MAG TPA: lipoprotein [Gammaproteobacteria bacterium]|nr:lipoprotein [Gammaproteobacteria bacterium]